MDVNLLTKLFYLIPSVEKQVPIDVDFNRAHNNTTAYALLKSQAGHQYYQLFASACLTIRRMRGRISYFSGFQKAQNRTMPSILPTCALRKVTSNALKVFFLYNTKIPATQSIKAKESWKL